MIPRAFIFLTFSAMYAGGVKLIVLGAPKNELLCGWRRVAVKFITKLFCRTGLFLFSFVWIRDIYVDADYSEWLGKDYKSKSPKMRPPIIISNHQSWSV